MGKASTGRKRAPYGDDPTSWGLLALYTGSRSWVLIY